MLRCRLDGLFEGWWGLDDGHGQARTLHGMVTSVIAVLAFGRRSTPKKWLGQRIRVLQDMGLTCRETERCLGYSVESKSRYISVRWQLF